MKRKSKVIIVLSGIFILLLLLAVLLYQGIIWFNMPSKSAYPIRGVDVSNYQGDIDWDILSEHDISFAFIKATEGSTFVDKKFKKNWENASKTELLIGAYHFFSYDSLGETQAANFINTVPMEKGTLAPVIDVEFYGDKKENPPQKEDVHRELGIMVEALEEYYGRKPILYAVEESYDLYLAGTFQDCPIWIRDVLKKPKLSDGRSWSIWQYSARGRLAGYIGKEKFIDMNVFDGTEEELKTLTIQ